MFWWFERDGAYMKCEVLQLPTGTYELRVVDPDGTEHIEDIATAKELAARQVTVERKLHAEGWTGPHGWVL